MKKTYLKSLKVFLTLLLLCGVCSAWAADPITIYKNEGATGTDASGVTASGNVNTTASNGNPGNSFANTSSSNTTFTFTGFDVSGYLGLQLSIDVKFTYPSTTTTYPYVTATFYKNDKIVKTDNTTISVETKITGYNTYIITNIPDFDKIILVCTPGTGKSSSGNPTTTYGTYMDNVTLTGMQSGPSKTLESITISGDLAKSTYAVGESFDFAGLTATGTYDDESTTDLTNSVEWSVSPSNLTSDIKSVTVTATFNEISDSKAYNIIVKERGYNIDFEEELSLYKWTFTNITKGKETISAHGGTYYGTTDGKATASLQTNTPIENPYSIQFFVSKTSTNKATASWIVSVSSDKKEWYQVGDLLDASVNITKGEWTEYNVDLHLYNNVYIKIEYSGTSAIRTIDDIKIITYVPATITSKGYATFSSDEALVLSKLPEGLTAYKATTVSNSKVKMVPVTSAVAAGTGLFLKGTASTTYSIPVAESGTDISSENLLVATDGTEVAAGNYVYVIASGAFQPLANATVVSKGKAYIDATSIPTEGKLEISFDEPTGINSVNAITDNKAIYNLQGVRVSENYKGVVIMNGKKYIK
ncbi:MAG: hypothetical protein Q4F34_03970 [Prevotellaceae bacterium]|nr:hypothetical protein [Prevotellaceae bacterium]